MSDDFQIAVERARQRFSDSWDLLSVHEKATAIYEELRELDRERMRQPPPPRSERLVSAAA